LAGAAAGQVNCQHSGLCCVVILTILNLRMDVWLSKHYGISVAEIHRMLPMWLIPVLTIALLAWIGLLIAASNRQKPQNETVEMD
jgi:predicted membrane protein